MKDNLPGLFPLLIYSAPKEESQWGLNLTDVTHLSMWHFYSFLTIFLHQGVKRAILISADKENLICHLTNVFVSVVCCRF